MTKFGDKYTREFFIGGREREFRLELINPQHMEIYEAIFDPKELRDAPIIISIDDVDASELDYEDRDEKIKNRAGKESESLLKYSRWVHKGQRKLFDSEVQFLTKYLDSHKEQAIFVYIGAAPSCKAWLFHLMFPNVKMLFIDPNKFLIKIDKTTMWDKRPDLGIVYLSGETMKTVSHFNGEKEVLASPPNIMREDPLDNPDNYEKYSKFIFESDNYIFLNQQYASKETAKFVNYLFDYSKKYGNYKTFLCSDLRTNTRDDGQPAEIDIVHDMLLNFIFLNISKPDYSMIKLRGMYEPVPAEDLEKVREYVDEVRDITGKDFGPAFLDASITFYEGTIYIQAWRGRYSTECRLHVSKDAILENKIREYPKKKFENVNYYYNAIARTSMYFKNPMVGVIRGMDNCGDCAIEGTIFKEYKDLSGCSLEDIKRYTNMLDEVNEQRLEPKPDESWNKHGTLIYKQ